MIGGFVYRGNGADEVIAIDISREGVALQRFVEFINGRAAKVLFQCLDEGNRLAARSLDGLDIAQRGIR